MEKEQHWFASHMLREKYIVFDVDVILHSDLYVLNCRFQRLDRPYNPLIKTTDKTQLHNTDNNML